MFLRPAKLRVRGLGVSGRDASEGIVGGSLEDWVILVTQRAGRVCEVGAGLLLCSSSFLVLTYDDCEHRDEELSLAIN